MVGKMNSLRIIIFALSIVYTLSLYANDRQDELIDIAKNRTELEIKKTLTNDFLRISHVEDILIDVDLKLDRQKLLPKLNQLNMDSPIQLNDYNLPGIFTGNKKNNDLNELKEIDNHSIIRSISSIRLEVFTGQKNIDLSKFKERFKQVLLLNYQGLTKSSVVVKVTSLEGVYSEKKTIDEPIAQKEGTYDFLQYFAGFGLLILLSIIIYVAYIIKNGMRSVSDSIESKEFTGNLTASLNNSTTNNKEKEDSLSSGGNGDFFELFYNGVDKLRFRLKNLKDLSQNIMGFYLETEQFENAAILSDCISNKEDVLNSTDDKYKQPFHDYLINKGERLFSNSEKLFSVLRQIDRGISLYSINAELFYRSNFKDICRKFSSKEIETIITKLNPSEFIFFIEFVDQSKLAFALSKTSIEIKSYINKSIDFDADMIKLLLVKVLSIKDGGREFVKVNSLDRILKYLDPDKEEIFLTHSKQKGRKSFYSLVKANESVVLSFLQQLSFEDKSSLLALFNDELRKSIINKLPDIIAERLRFSKGNISEQSFELKAILFEKLINTRQVGGANESDSEIDEAA